MNISETDRAQLADQAKENRLKVKAQKELEKDHAERMVQSGMGHKMQVSS